MSDNLIERLRNSDPSWALNDLAADALEAMQNSGLREITTDEMDY